MAPTICIDSSTIALFICTAVELAVVCMLALADGTREHWYGDSGVMKRGPFLVDDRGVGPLITQRGHVVIYAVDSGKQACYVTDGRTDRQRGHEERAFPGG